MTDPIIAWYWTMPDGTWRVVPGIELPAALADHDETHPGWRPIYQGPNWGTQESATYISKGPAGDYCCPACGRFYAPPLVADPRYDERVSIRSSLAAASNALESVHATLERPLTSGLVALGLVKGIQLELRFSRVMLDSCLSQLSRMLGHPKTLSSEAPNIETALVQEVCTQLAKLRGFAQELFEDYPDYGAVEGWDLEDMAIRHGLLAPTHVSERCGENCACAAYGEGFPMTCNKRTAVLTGVERT